MDISFPPTQESQLLCVQLQRRAGQHASTLAADLSLPRVVWFVFQSHEAVN